MKTNSEQLKAFAKRALQAVEHCDIFIGVTNKYEEDSSENIEFLIQLAHCIMHDKQIIIPAPFGAEVPAKLMSVADRVVRYDPERLETLPAAINEALIDLGITGSSE